MSIQTVTSLKTRDDKKAARRIKPVTEVAVMRTWPLQALMGVMTTIMMITTISTISERGKEHADKEISVFRLTSSC